MRSKFIGAILLSVSSIGLQAQNFIQIQNRWKSTEHIHAERETPESGAIEPGWWSVQWVIEAVAETGYVQIKNRWKNTNLHIQTASCLAELFNRAGGARNGRLNRLQALTMCASGTGGNPR